MKRTEITEGLAVEAEPLCGLFCQQAHVARGKFFLLPRGFSGLLLTLSLTAAGDFRTTASA
jgi:hypothetical protein